MLIGFLGHETHIKPELQQYRYWYWMTAEFLEMIKGPVLVRNTSAYG
jgi:hypothetical protein